MTQPLKTFTSIQTGDALPEREHVVSEVQLMLYNAALWNGHRIHFDEPYTKDVEGYPGLVVAGPLLGDWMHQAIDEWIGSAGLLKSMEYSNRQAAYVGETLTVGGEVTSIDEETGELTLDVFVRNATGDLLAPGVAVVNALADGCPNSEGLHEG